ncbi:flavin reductase family protein [Nocardiopsis sp. LOL_012]|uniref:flavin reductase family protein n=1 Tax=Nocardiopsis sp. LOL_012 TaxID=3345409 RepID=UPI003A89DF35
MTSPSPTARSTDIREEPGALRDGLAHMATSVSVVTTEISTGRHGFTANSVVSVSAEPPLIAVFLATKAECHEAFSHTETLAVNVLADGQEGLARVFATRGADKFAATGFVPGDLGAPVLPEAALVLEGTVHSLQHAGDHTMILAEVSRVRRHDAEPLVYQGRRFRRLGAA